MNHGTELTTSLGASDCGHVPNSGHNPTFYPVPGIESDLGSTSIPGKSRIVFHRFRGQSDRPKLCPTGEVCPCPELDVCHCGGGICSPQRPSGNPVQFLKFEQYYTDDLFV